MIEGNTPEGKKENSYLVPLVLAHSQQCFTMQDNSIIHVCCHSGLVNAELARYLSTCFPLDDVHFTSNGLCCERVVTVCVCDAV
jgi:hypothetical protein